MCAFNCFISCTALCDFCLWKALYKEPRPEDFCLFYTLKDWQENIYTATYKHSNIQCFYYYLSFAWKWLRPSITGQCRPFRTRKNTQWWQCLMSQSTGGLISQGWSVWRTHCAAEQQVAVKELKCDAWPERCSCACKQITTVCVLNKLNSLADNVTLFFLNIITSCIFLFFFMLTHGICLKSRTVPSSWDCSCWEWKVLRINHGTYRNKCPPTLHYCTATDKAFQACIRHWGWPD